MVILSSIVQAGMSVLPWYIYDLPFQRMLDIEDMVLHDMENRQVSVSTCRNICPGFRFQT